MLSSAPSSKPAASNRPNSTAASKPKSERESNLAPLLRHFVGLDLIVETKQGRSYRGRLREADAYMNLVLSRPAARRSEDGSHSKPETGSSAIGTSGASGRGESFDWVHIRGPSIRYVAFGANVDVAGVVRAGRDRERAAGDRYRRGVRKAPRK